MESDPRSELGEINRLGESARAAATDRPLASTVVLLVAEMVLVLVLAFAGLSTGTVIGWLVFLAAFHFVVRSRRRARPRRRWANAESRRLALWAAVATVALNAVWIPLFFLARPVALALLFAGLVASLVSTVVMTRHA